MNQDLASTPTTPGAPTKCKHLQFQANVQVARTEESLWPYVCRFAAGVRVQCADCGMPFAFPNMPLATDTTNGVSPDGMTAALIIVPARKDQ